MRDRIRIRVLSLRSPLARRNVRLSNREIGILIFPMFTSHRVNAMALTQIKSIASSESAEHRAWDKKLERYLSACAKDRERDHEATRDAIPNMFIL
jgi:hypothetical protein